MTSDLKLAETEADEFRAKYNIQMGSTPQDEQDEDDKKNVKKNEGGGGVLA